MGSFRTFVDVGADEPVAGPAGVADAAVAARDINTRCVGVALRQPGSTLIDSVGITAAANAGSGLGRVLGAAVVVIRGAVGVGVGFRVAATALTGLGLGRIIGTTVFRVGHTVPVGIAIGVGAVNLPVAVVVDAVVAEIVGARV